MPPLTQKIDFAVIINVHNANPNGDPLNGNRPRQTADRLGEISDVCLKRKLRNRLLAMGEDIFVQSDDNRSDEYRSLYDRFNASGIALDRDVRQAVCNRWFDVRAFGQVFAFKADEDAGSVSIGVRGPVTIQSAYSLAPIVAESIQITKSVNLETNENPDTKDSDTMGMKHRVSKAVYVAYGAISPQLAVQTGFSNDDAERIKQAFQSLFEGDASSARPEGSMEVSAVVWCAHNSPCGQYSSAKVHRVIKDHINQNGEIDEKEIRAALPGVAVNCLSPLEGDELLRLTNRS